MSDLSESARSKQYLIALFAACLGVLGVVGIGLRQLAARNALAPIPITGNLCLDEKLEVLRNRGGLHADVVAVGSSMSFDDLYSEEVLKHLPLGFSYYNLGAWQLKVSDDRKLAGLFEGNYRPKLVLMDVGVMDFIKYEPHQISPSMLREIQWQMDNRWTPALFIRHFDIEYYWSNRDISRKRSVLDDMLSLQADDWGGLTREDRFRSPRNPHFQPISELGEIDPREYDELAELSASLNRLGIPLVVTQVPMPAESVARSRTDFARHLERIRQIVTSHGQIWIDLHALPGITDDLYADRSHLRKEGAEIFTRALFQNLESRHPELTRRSISAFR